MTTFDDRSFGDRRDDLDYYPRPGAYALIEDEGRVLVVEEGSGIFLPGGGLEDGESPREALDRELAEETGLAVETARRLGRADQWITRRAGPPMQKICHLYRVRPGRRIRPPEQTDCPSRWLSPADAIDQLRHEVFRWVVDQFAGASRTGETG